MILELLLIWMLFNTISCIFACKDGGKITIQTDNTFVFYSVSVIATIVFSIAFVPLLIFSIITSRGDSN